tara:strand:+ start:755 stop:1201 length:447 start_codon:yes stop_codon:yes gene_type:complete
MFDLQQEELKLIKVKALDEKATVPQKSHPSDAGFDIFTTESHTIKSGESHLFSTGIACEIPSGYCALLWDRSSLGSKGVHRLAGVIDSSYRGEWKVCLINLSDKDYEVESGDKICQAIIQKVEYFDFDPVDELSDTDRGQGGFGSTGR